MNDAAERAEYARCAARDLAASLAPQLEAAIEAVQTDPGKRVRLGLSVVIAVDGSTGEIRPEYVVKRSESAEARLLPPIPIGKQLTMFGAQQSEEAA